MRNSGRPKSPGWAQGQIPRWETGDEVSEQLKQNVTLLYAQILTLMVARVTRLWTSFNFQDGATHFFHMLPHESGGPDW